ncbi:histone lysine methyltransferase set1, partial [Cystoisospora suis]
MNTYECNTGNERKDEEEERGVKQRDSIEEKNNKKKMRKRDISCERAADDVGDSFIRTPTTGGIEDEERRTSSSSKGFSTQAFSPSFSSHTRADGKIEERHPHGEGTSMLISSHTGLDAQGGSAGGEVDRLREEGMSRSKEETNEDEERKVENKEENGEDKEEKMKVIVGEAFNEIKNVPRRNTSLLLSSSSDINEREEKGEEEKAPTEVKDGEDADEKEREEREKEKNSSSISISSSQDLEKHSATMPSPSSLERTAIEEEEEDMKRNTKEGEQRTARSINERDTGAFLSQDKSKDLQGLPRHPSKIEKPPLTLLFTPPSEIWEDEEEDSRHSDRPKTERHELSTSDDFSSLSQTDTMKGKKEKDRRKEEDLLKRRKTAGGLSRKEENEENRYMWDDWICPDCAVCRYCCEPLTLPPLGQEAGSSSNSSSSSSSSNSNSSSSGSSSSTTGSSNSTSSGQHTSSGGGGGSTGGGGSHQPYVNCHTCNMYAHGACCYPPVPELHPIATFRCDACTKCLSCGYVDLYWPEYANWDIQFQRCSTCHHAVEAGQYCPICMRVWGSEGTGGGGNTLEMITPQPDSTSSSSPLPASSPSISRTDFNSLPESSTSTTTTTTVSHTATAAPLPSSSSSVWMTSRNAEIVQGGEGEARGSDSSSSSLLLSSPGVENWIMCDGCKLWVHARCDRELAEIFHLRRLNSRDVHYRCPVCRGSSRSLRYKRLLDQLISFDKTSEFTLPAASSFTLYWRVVTRPMDLTTMKQKVKKNVYRDDDSQVIRDLHQIFHNARMVNMPNTRTYKIALAMEKKAKELITGILQLQSSSSLSSSNKKSGGGGGSSGSSTSYSASGYSSTSSNTLLSSSSSAGGGGGSGYEDSQGTLLSFLPSCLASPSSLHHEKVEENAEERNAPYRHDREEAEDKENEEIHMNLSSSSSRYGGREGVRKTDGKRREEEAHGVTLFASDRLHEISRETQEEEEDEDLQESTTNRIARDDNSTSHTSIATAMTTHSSSSLSALSLRGASPSQHALVQKRRDPGLSRALHFSRKKERNIVRYPHELFMLRSPHVPFFTSPSSLLPIKFPCDLPSSPTSLLSISTPPPFFQACYSTSSSSSFLFFSSSFSPPHTIFGEVSSWILPSPREGCLPYRVYLPSGERCEERERKRLRSRIKRRRKDLLAALSGSLVHDKRKMKKKAKMSHGATSFSSSTWKGSSMILRETKEEKNAFTSEEEEEMKIEGISRDPYLPESTYVMPSPENTQDFLRALHFLYTCKGGGGRETHQEKAKEEEKRRRRRKEEHISPPSSSSSSSLVRLQRCHTEVKNAREDTGVVGCTEFDTTEKKKKRNEEEREGAEEEEKERRQREKEEERMPLLGISDTQEEKENLSSSSPSSLCNTQAISSFSSSSPSRLAASLSSSLPSSFSFHSQSSFLFLDSCSLCGSPSKQEFMYHCPSCGESFHAQCLGLPPISARAKAQEEEERSKKEIPLKIKGRKRRRSLGEEEIKAEENSDHPSVSARSSSSSCPATNSLRPIQGKNEKEKMISQLHSSLSCCALSKEEEEERREERRRYLSSLPINAVTCPSCSVCIECLQPARTSPGLRRDEEEEREIRREERKKGEGEEKSLQRERFLRMKEGERMNDKKISECVSQREEERNGETKMRDREIKRKLVEEVEDQEKKHLFDVDVYRCYECGVTAHVECLWRMKEEEEEEQEEDEEDEQGASSFSPSHWVTNEGGVSSVSGRCDSPKRAATALPLEEDKEGRRPSAKASSREKKFRETSSSCSPSCSPSSSSISLPYGDIGRGERKNENFQSRCEGGEGGRGSSLLHPSVNHLPSIARSSLTRGVGQPIECMRSSPSTPSYSITASSEYSSGRISGRPSSSFSSSALPSHLTLEKTGQPPPFFHDLLAPHPPPLPSDWLSSSPSSSLLLLQHLLPASSSSSS